MAKLHPEFSFDREGRSLSAWLLDLVADDAPTRLKAGDVLQGMWFGVPYAHTDLSHLDWDELQRLPGQSERFCSTVRHAVAASDFPKADFVRRLILYRIVLHQDWLRRVDKSQSRQRSESEPDEYINRIVRRLKAAGDETERTEAAIRLCRWFRASVGRGVEADGAIHEGAETLTHAGMASHLVFNALDVALLVDRPGLRAMLDDGHHRSEALQALERIGSPALDFAPSLFARLDAETTPYRFDAAKALGSIGRDDPAVVDALLTRLGSRSQAVAAGAAECLAWAGPPLAGRADEASALLLEAARRPESGLAFIEALASVGRDREDALGRVLELAEPKPPRWIDDEGFPEHRYNQTMYDRGVAIVALRHFRSFAVRIVPALSAAIDTFEEYDPDYQYAGDHERICRTLSEFGPDAAPAVPKLAAYLDEWRRRPEDGDQYPRAVFDALAAIGPAAARALPLLEAISLGLYHDEAEDLDCNDPLDAAILAIRG